MPSHRRPRSRKWEDPASPLQAARYQRRWSQLDVCQRVRAVCPGHRSGEACKFEPSKLSEYEHQKRLPGVTHVIALAKVFGRTPEQLGLLQRPGISTDGEESRPTGSAVVFDADDPSRTSMDRAGYATSKGASDFPEGGKPRVAEDDDVMLRHLAGGWGGEQMRRDTFLRGVGAAAGAAAIDPFVLMSQQARENINHTKVSDEQIEHLRIAVGAHARSGYHADQEARVKALVTDWAIAHRLLDQPLRQQQRQELLDIFARLTAIMSLKAFDYGQYERARSLRETAKDAAREVGDLDLLAWLYDRECEAAIVLDGSTYDVLELGLQGLDIIGSSQTLTAAKLNGWVAHGYAGTGDEFTAFTHMEQAERLLAKSIPGCWASGADMPRGYTFGEDNLAGMAAGIYLSLDKYGQAIEQCERQETLHRELGLPMKTAHVVTKNRLHRATTMLRMGEVEGSTQAAMNALSSYEGSAVPVILREARRFGQELAAADTGGAYAREFAEFLRSRG